MCKGRFERRYSSKMTCRLGPCRVFPNMFQLTSEDMGGVLRDPLYANKSRIPNYYV